MRVVLAESGAVLSPGQPVLVAVEVTNDLEVIDGVSATIPDRTGLTWTANPAVLPLFPDGVGRIAVELDVSATFPAGTHKIPIELRSAVGGQAPTVRTLSLTVPELPDGTIAVDPPVRGGRRRASYTVRFVNTGNARLEVALGGTDPSRGARTTFTRPVLRVSPGGSAASTMEVSGKRRWFGAELSHQVTVLGTAGELERDTKAVFRQRPMVPRGLRTVAALGAIVAVWAAIFVVVLGHVLSKDPLTKQVPASFYAPVSTKASKAKLASLGGGAVGLAAAGASAPAGAVPKSGVVIGVGGTISGTVEAASTGAGIGRINVEALEAGPRGLTTVASAATSSNGHYAIEGLLPGSYKLLFAAQGFRSVWYPAATSASAARAVTVDALDVTAHVDAVVAGSPGTITGTVGTGQTPSPPVTVTVQPEQGSTSQPLPTVRTNAAGSYTIRNLPTPGQYDLSFSAKGYQVASSTDQLSGGETLVANTVSLGASAGSISGVVSAGGSDLGGVSITAQANGQTYTSATPTTGPVGRFSFASLPSPATYLLTFSKAGYGTRVVGVDLGPGQDLTTLAVVMDGGAGQISGVVSSSTGAPLGGATVTVDGGSTAVSTQSLTAGTVGAYSLSGLATPGTYTLTFSVPGYESQTVAVPLASSGSASAVDVRLPPALGTIGGTVTSTTGVPLTGVDVTATDGTTVTTTKTTSQPAGGFLLSGLAPGSYSVTFSFVGYGEQTFLVSLPPGGSRSVQAQLAAG